MGLNDEWESDLSNSHSGVILIYVNLLGHLPYSFQIYLLGWNYESKLKTGSFLSISFLRHEKKWAITSTVQPFPNIRNFW